ncbi:MAG: phosphoribosyltransferase [Nitrososphaerota archaeon]|nr:phosphoribosyltransferase [Candidatus Geocrenenecus dongiae]
MIFKDRKDAGLRLAKALYKFRESSPVVFGIPRGGVEVGYYVALELDCPLEVTIPRKIGAPLQPELAVGAVAEDGTIYVEEEVARMVGVDERYIRSEAEKELQVINRRLKLYRGGRELGDLSKYTVIVVDDGVATGATMIATLRFMRKKNPHTLVCAVPVSPPETIPKLSMEADEVVCLETPTPFYAIGQFYEDFRQLRDEEVVEYLSRTKKIT